MQLVYRFKGAPAYRATLSYLVTYNKIRCYYENRYAVAAYKRETKLNARSQQQPQAQECRSLNECNLCIRQMQAGCCDTARYSCCQGMDTFTEKLGHKHAHRYVQEASYTLLVNLLYIHCLEMQRTLNLTIHLQVKLLVPDWVEFCRHSPGPLFHFTDLNRYVRVRGAALVLRYEPLSADDCNTNQNFQNLENDSEINVFSFYSHC
jgi:hypothetical protein